MILRVTRSHRPIAHGSGPLNARSRRALGARLAPRLTEACRALSLGAPRRLQIVERGTHHLVWHVRTDAGEFAVRAAAATRVHSEARHRARETLWRRVGDWGIAPAYRGSLPLRDGTFRGWLEVFDWHHGRALRAEHDAAAVARTLAALHARPAGEWTAAAPRVDCAAFLRARLADYARRTDGLVGVSSSLRQQWIAVRRAMLRIPRSNSGASRLVHNDLVDGNVLVGGRDAVLIDWDWAMVTNPVVDLFCFLSPFVRSWGERPRFLSRRAVRSFLEAYAQERGRTHTRRLLAANVPLWLPYNVAVALWLAVDAPRRPHTRRAGFQRDALAECAILGTILAEFK